MKVFGLIGKKLQHSFSKKYFTEKFKQEALLDFRYELFELENITEVNGIFLKKEVKGFNVTVPYKEDIIPFLDQLDKSASEVGAVNVVKVENGKKTGYNSDYFGFKRSLLNWTDQLPNTALVLGTGGASKAVIAALKSMNIKYKTVSRTDKGDIKYADISAEVLGAHKLIINTTPLGMFPDTSTYPDIPYESLSEGHFIYDLVYNPENTSFMLKAEQKGSKTKNGLEMLHLQAEKSWEIWNS